MEDDTRQPDLQTLGEPEPPAEPEHQGEPAAEPELPKPVRLKPLDDTRGFYVVLWAQKPQRGHRADYQEVGYVKAHDGPRAKKAVMDEAHPASAFLRHRAAQRGGILLRAVPALNWPAEVEPTTYVRPDPVLSIG
jgi:hypothetical protein